MRSRTVKTAVISIALIALTLTGCSTQFHGSAPADNDQIYVVGSRVKFMRGWVPTVWICPEKDAGECREVDVRVRN